MLANLFQADLPGVLFQQFPLQERGLDALAVIGKGHETYRDREGVKTPFLERELLEEYAQQIGLE